MPVQAHFPSSHSNQYSADSACGHCNGIIRHEHWCITQNAGVQYAYQVVSDASQLSSGDHLILHALGTAWTGRRILSKLGYEQDGGKFNIKEFGGHDAF
jgi:hypothetical protein